MAPPTQARCKAMGKSEASISKYLARLRLQLNDELFIRHPHHMEPTDYLKRQLPKIADALEKLETCLISGEFEPENYEKTSQSVYRKPLNTHLVTCSQWI